MGAVTFEDEPPPAGTAPAAASSAVTFDDAPPALSREREIRLEALKKLMVKPPDVLDRAVDQYTLGMTRPLKGISTVVEGKANEWFGGGKPATAGEYYRGGVGAQGDYFDEAVRTTPGPAGTAADLVGAVGSGFSGTGGKLLSKGGQAAIAGLQGAIGGASRNAEDVGSAVKGALGGTVDAATSWTLGGLLDRFKGVKKPEALGGGRVADVAGARKEIDVASRGGNSQTVED